MSLARWILVLLLAPLGGAALGGPSAIAAGFAPGIGAPPQGVGIEERLGTVVPDELRFTDESGRQVTLGSLRHGRPQVLIMAYQECPSLCSLVVAGFLKVAKQVDVDLGRAYDAVFVSLDPNESSEVSQKRRRAFLASYGRPAAADGVHFLTGEQSEIRRLADVIGFHYKYDDKTRQYAHGAGMTLLAANGRVAQYLLGLSFAPSSFVAGLDAARGARPPTLTEKIKLLCFQDSLFTGKYNDPVLLGVRLLSLASLGFVGFFVAARRFGLRRRGGKADPPR